MSVMVCMCVCSGIRGSVNESEGEDKRTSDTAVEQERHTTD